MKKPNFPWKLRFLLFISKLRGRNRIVTPELPIEENRENNDKAARAANHLYNKKVEIAHIENYEFGGQKLRTYRNSDKPNQKVILYFHGGGMMFYDLEAQDYNCRRMCLDNDCAVVNANYRLAPENKFPAAHDDAAAMLNWVHENIELLHGDKSKIITMGDSAGANLAGYLAGHARDNKKIPNLMAQVLIYPWTDVNSAQYQSAKDYGDKNYVLSMDDIEFFTNAYFASPEDAANPSANLMAQANLKAMPQTLILVAQFDPLCDQGVAYGEKLRAAGVQTQTIYYKNAVHGFMSFLDAQFKNSEPLNDIKAFISTI
ncbi:MAG: lipase/esterase [Hyphomonadaceae bacterium]|nr:MAG: lipase/esterase [Hyphomonadaceae bacterium]KAF0186107.1 MAG: lipase/esterase [Hyphomonadaceae bacterium]